MTLWCGMPRGARRASQGIWDASWHCLSAGCAGQTSHVGHRVWDGPTGHCAWAVPTQQQCLLGLAWGGKPREAETPWYQPGSLHPSVPHSSPALWLPLRFGVQHCWGHREPAYPWRQQHLHHQDHRGRRCPEGRAPADWGPPARGKPRARASSEGKLGSVLHATVPVLNLSTPPTDSPAPLP